MAAPDLSRSSSAHLVQVSHCRRCVTKAALHLTVSHACLLCESGSGCPEIVQGERRTAYLPGSAPVRCCQHRLVYDLACTAGWEEQLVGCEIVVLDPRPEVVQHWAGR